MVAEMAKNGYRFTPSVPIYLSLLEQQPHLCLTKIGLLVLAGQFLWEGHSIYFADILTDLKSG